MIMKALLNNIRQLYGEPVTKYGIFFLGMYVVFLAFAFTYFPRNTAVIMRHAGIFFSDRLVIGACLLVLLVAYILFFRHAREWVQTRRQIRIVIFFAVLFMLIMLVVPPFFSSDLFGNGSRAIIATVHEVNPYTVPPNDLGYQEYVAWGEKGAPYGPLFTGFTMVLARITGGDIFLFGVVFRIIAIGLVLVIAWFIYDCIRRLNASFARVGTSLFLWNPFVLFELVQSSHNDIFVVLCIVVAVWLCLRKRFVGALIILTAGYLVKFIPAVLIPLVGILLIMNARTVALALKKILLAILGAAAVVFFAYLPFGGLVENVGNAISGFIQYDHLTFPQAIITVIVTGATKIVSGTPPTALAIRVAYLAVFFLVYIVMVIRPRLTEPDQYIQRMLWILFAFVFLLGAKLNIWYVLWFLPLLLLVRQMWYHTVVILVTMLGFLYYFMLNVFFPTVIFFVLLLGWYIYWQWWGSSAPRRT